ncbi:MAG: SDR family oxidoreductase [Clostridiales bacterium]|nr:SDR family oxidoreductase [Clostridiales bacterium]
MFDLKGKRALVTGSTQGIGYAIAECLAKQGADVVVHGSSSYEKCANAAARIFESCNGEANLGIAVSDLSKPDGADKLYEAVGDVDILVLNASIQYRKKWNEITPEEMEIQLQTNLKSSLRLIQLCAPHMEREAWGRIVTVGSVQQYKPHRDMAIYAASKSAQMNLVTNLAKQLAPLGININNLSPGVIATPRNADALADAEYAKKVLEGIPAGFAGEAEDCAAAALLLCSNEGRYITGIDLTVDGGMKL